MIFLVIEFVPFGGDRVCPQPAAPTEPYMNSSRVLFFCYFVNDSWFIAEILSLLLSGLTIKMFILIDLVFDFFEVFLPFGTEMTLSGR